MDTSQIISFLTASVVLTLSPGPDIVYVLTSSLRFGFKSAFYLAFGLCSGLIVHTLLVGFGVSQDIMKNDQLFWVVKIFGSLYMLFIAYRIYKSPATIELTERQESKKSNIGYYSTGFLMNVLNPKVTLFFLAFFPQFINYKSGYTLNQAFVLGGIFFAQTLVIFTLVAYYASGLTSKIQGNSKLENALKYFQIAIFVFLSVSILVFQ